MKRNFLQKRHLKTAVFTGLIAGIIISCILALLVFAWGRDGRSLIIARGSFRQELALYDLYGALEKIPAPEDSDEIEQLISSLERSASTVEEHLSVLKRIRILALADSYYVNIYENASRKSAAAHPYSAPIAAVAAEAAVMGGDSPQENQELRGYALRLSRSLYPLVELGIWILAGDLENPAKAAAVPGLSRLLAQDLSALPPQARENLLVNEFLLLAHEGDVSGASFALNGLVEDSIINTVDDGDRGNADTGDSFSPEIVRMGAEFHFDHRNFLIAAELFSRLGSEAELGMASDALALAGEQGAKNFWLALSGSETPTLLRSRSLYNLASSAGNAEEASLWLENLLAVPLDPDDPARIFGILRSVRLMDAASGTAVLADPITRQNPLLDLEMLRLQMDSLPQRRIQAETWMLLERHPENADLHEWAAWYFLNQRFYSESAGVILEASRKGISGHWLSLHNSLSLLREGRINEGEAVLRGIENLVPEWAETGASWSARDGWLVLANLGRTRESREEFAAALEYYRAAEELLKPGRERREEKVSLQVRISRCLLALGRTEESIEALEYAVKLDPENIHLHRELRLLRQ